MGQPDGGMWQNFVGIRPLKKSFNDLERSFEACVSCEVERSTVFTLRGLCKNSLLETEFFTTICKGYIGFIGLMTSIWYATL